MARPPGLIYLATFLPNLFISASATYICLGHLVPRFLSISFPGWVMVLACVVSRPSAFIVTKLLKPWVDARAAAAHGARLPPGVKGSISSIMTRLSESFKTGYPGQTFHEFCVEAGNTVMIRLPSADLVVTIEPEHVKSMLATQADNFEKGPVFFEQFKSLLGIGIFNVDGEMWKFHRAITRPFFTRERISDFEIYNRKALEAIRLAKERLSEGYSIDFQDLAGRFTLDSATGFMLGEDVGSLSAGIPYPSCASYMNSNSSMNHPANRFLTAFAEAQEFSAARSGLGEDWPLFEFWKDGVAPRRQVIDDFTQPILERALEKWEAKKSGRSQETEDENEGCLLDHLVMHTQDRTILKDEVMNLFVAGRDTTAGLLSFAVYMLAEHPDIEARLREEIFEKVGPTEQPTYAHMREMRYVRAFLNEVLRLYPPVPIDNRSANKSVTLPSRTGAPFYIPKGTTCFYSVMYMHRRKDLWGPDALTFDPMRFIDDRLHKYLTPNPFIFSPFNAGPRVCPGQQFAYHEATFFLIRLLQNFTGFELDHRENTAPDPEWKNWDDLRATDKIRLTSSLTMSVKGGLWVRMREYNLD